jgi:ribonuclease HI
MRVLCLFTDGGSRSNPGPAATGWVIKRPSGEIIKKGGRFLGRATNNEAEYLALIEGLRELKEYSPGEVECFLDSKLVVEQLNGNYKTKEPRLKKLLFEAKKLEQELGAISYTHVPRGQNKEADAIVNQILDRHE